MLSQVITEKLTFPYNLSLWDYCPGLVRFKGKLYVGPAHRLRQEIIDYMHALSVGGHSRTDVTIQRIVGVF